MAGLVLRFFFLRKAFGILGSLGNFSVSLFETAFLLSGLGVGETAITSILGSAMSFFSIKLVSLGLSEGADALRGDGDCPSKLFNGDAILLPGDPRNESSLVPNVSIVAKECVGETAAAADVHIGCTGGAWA